MNTTHASAVLIGERGVLIRGPSGSGKSALALALIDGWPRDARLIADDRVILSASANRVYATVPGEIAGLIELRGLGILRRDFVSPASIDLVADLLPPAECPRLPDLAQAQAELAGTHLPRVCLAIGRPDLPLRVRAAIAHLIH